MDPRTYMANEDLTCSLGFYLATPPHIVLAAKVARVSRLPFHSLLGLEVISQIIGSSPTALGRKTTGVK